ncbi:MAG: glycoside hydrolase family protein, partial [Phenylobacterium sp.]
ENFRRSSVLRRLNEGALLQAACGMEMWRKADFEGERIVIDALVRRRAAEKLLFLTPTNGFLPAPTPILAPRIDHDVAGSIPSQAPVELKAQMHGDRAIAERIGPIGVLRPSPPEEDESPSRTQVAAAEITARLQSILTESEPDAAAPIAAPSPPAPDAASDLDQPPAPPEADAAPDFNLTPPPAEQEPLRLQPEMEARPESMPEPEPELFTAEPMRFADFASERSSEGGFDEFAELENAPVEPVKAFGGLPLLLGLAILGLIVFTGALFFGFSARPHDGLFSLPNLIVGGLGLTGIGCVATAVYFIFERLGGREDE